MSRVERCKQYSNPVSQKNWDGEACDRANIKRWVDRATENSKVAPRAKSEMKLPDTGAVALHDTAKPRGQGDVRRQAKADLNHAGGSTYLGGIRRNA